MCLSERPRPRFLFRTTVSHSILSGSRLHYCEGAQQPRTLITVEPTLAKIDGLLFDRTLGSIISSPECSPLVALDALSIHSC